MLHYIDSSQKCRYLILNIDTDQHNLPPSASFIFFFENIHLLPLTTFLFVLLCAFIIFLKKMFYSSFLLNSVPCTHISPAPMRDESFPTTHKGTMSVIWKVPHKLTHIQADKFMWVQCNNMLLKHAISSKEGTFILLDLLYYLVDTNAMVRDKKKGLQLIPIRRFSMRLVFFTIF